MKIGVASSGLGHVARGIETWALDLGRALAERGEAVTLYKGGGRSEAAYERVVSCWKREDEHTRRLLRRLPHALGWRLGLGSGYQVEQTTFGLGLLADLRRERVDVLHVQDPHLALIAERARRFGVVRTRTILAHGTEETCDFQRKFVYLQHLAPWHLEESRASGAWRPTWTAIPNFVDTTRFCPGNSEGLRAELELPASATVVLTASAIKSHHKRVDYLIAEFAELLRRAPDLPAYLVVAGGWEPETDALIARGRALLGDRVRFLVRFPHQRMPELYRAADVFVLGSLKEMMPIALLEAMASGLPCLTHRHPVMEWIVGSPDMSIDMGTPGALAARLGAWVADAAARRDVGARARRRCLEQFGRDRVVDRILDYYQFVHTDGRSLEARQCRVSLRESVS